MTPTPAPFSFDDGNVVVLTQNQYFIVHQDVLSHHSSSLDSALKVLQENSPRLFQGRPVLELQESPGEIYYLLTALYDGV
jgi:hypothetical protein